MDQPGEDVRGLRPGPPLAGALRAPGSKSAAQRLLLAAAVAQGRTRLEALPAGEDVDAARALVAALAPGAGELEVEGRGAGDLQPTGPLEVGESATLARLALGLLAFGARPDARVELRARGSLLARGAPALRAALERAGVAFEGDGWPWRFTAVAPPDALRLEAPRSSQELSALLLALAAHAGERVVEVRGDVPSRPYVELTRSVLARFGAEVDVEPRADGSRWRVRGPLRAPAAALAVEPDASSAAVALCAGAVSGGAVRALGLAPDSAQGDVRIAEHLRAFGCRATWGDAGLEVCGAPTRPATLDLSGNPDLAPPLAVVAAAAAGPRHGEAWSELGGLGTLDAKESPRLDGLVEGLRAAGWRAERTADALRVGARVDPDDVSALVLDPRGDHRMAFAFALLGLLRPNLRVRGAACVAKSWPGFWDDLAALGARPAR